MFAHFLLRPLSVLGSLSLAELACGHGGCAVCFGVWAGNHMRELMVDYHVHDIVTSGKFISERACSQTSQLHKYDFKLKDNSATLAANFYRY
jgi:hypothetical protein